MTHPDDELHVETQEAARKFHSRARTHPPRASTEVLADQAQRWEALGVPELDVPAEVYFPTAAELAAKEGIPVQDILREATLDATGAQRAPPRRAPAQRSARDMDDDATNEEVPP